MSGLPPGWTQARIGELCVLRNGRAFKPSEWKLRGLPIVRIQNLKDRSVPFNHFDEPIEDKFSLKGGELLFAWSGTPGTSFGAHIWDRGPAVLNQHIFRIDFDERAIDKRFFRYAINHKIDELVGVAHGGVGLGHVTKGVFESTCIPLPPRSEQERIADKLDAVLARLNFCRDRLGGVPETLRRFREAVLEAAVSGTLTEDYGGDWTHVPLEMLIESIRTGTTAVPAESLTKFPVLRSSSVRPFEVDMSDCRFVSRSDPENRATFLAQGDLLFTRLSGSAEYVGNCALVRTVPRGGMQYPDRLFRVRLQNPGLAPYVELAFNSPAARAQVEARLKSSAGHQRISTEAITKAVIPLPPETVRDCVVERAYALLKRAAAVERRAVSVLSTTTALGAAALRAAFRGELVPQDPAEEPAREMLERINAGQKTAEPSNSLRTSTIVGSRLRRKMGVREVKGRPARREYS